MLFWGLAIGCCAILASIVVGLGRLAEVIVSRVRHHKVNTDV